MEESLGGASLSSPSSHGVLDDPSVAMYEANGLLTCVEPTSCHPLTGADTALILVIQKGVLNHVFVIARDPLHIEDP